MCSSDLEYVNRRKKKQAQEAAKILETVDVRVEDSRPIRQIIKTARKFAFDGHERLQCLKQDLDILNQQIPGNEDRVPLPVSGNSKKAPPTYEQKLADFEARLKIVETKLANIQHAVSEESKRNEALIRQSELLEQRAIATISQARHAGRLLFDDPESHNRLHGGPGISNCAEP